MQSMQRYAGVCRRKVKNTTSLFSVLIPSAFSALNAPVFAAALEATPFKFPVTLGKTQ